MTSPQLDPGFGLTDVDLDAIGPQPGDRFPDVVLPDQTGTMVDLHERRAGRPAIVVVHRSADW